jgi:hypothetical protein
MRYQHAAEGRDLQIARALSAMAQPANSGRNTPDLSVNSLLI